eukprot:COSAG01_NODE_45_length_32100_cov_28.037218_5_plen_99_part_00
MTVIGRALGLCTEVPANNTMFFSFIYVLKKEASYGDFISITWGRLIEDLNHRNLPPNNSFLNPPSTVVSCTTTCMMRQHHWPERLERLQRQHQPCHPT